MLIANVARMVWSVATFVNWWLAGVPTDEPSTRRSSRWYPVSAGKENSGLSVPFVTYCTPAGTMLPLSPANASMTNSFVAAVSNVTAGAAQVSPNALVA